MDYKVEGVSPRGRPKNTWRYVVGKILSGVAIKQGKCYGLLHENL